MQSAVVLHRRLYRDTSLLLEVFTRDYGRVGLVARGARRHRSRLKGALQPFNPLLLSWVGRGELMTLTGAEETGLPLRLPPARLLSGLYLNELLLLMLPRLDPFPDLFLGYLGTLRKLVSGAAEEPALRIFEKRLLADLGYGLVLDVEVLTNVPIESHKRYRYALDSGPMMAERAQTGLEMWGKSLLALGAESLEDPATLKEVKRLTRAAIEKQLQGRPLKTRELWLAKRRRDNIDESIKITVSGTSTR
jgi:DNA repair protein RecO (recombination protein O)